MKFKTQGVCAREINFEVENNKITHVDFVGGCAGNAQGVARLVEGMAVDEAIRKLDGIQCGPRRTSCPDQLAKALKIYLSGPQRVSSAENSPAADKVL